MAHEEDDALGVEGLRVGGGAEGDGDGKREEGKTWMPACDGMTCLMGLGHFTEHRVYFDGA
jgi:hypothetical protein